MTTEGHDEDDVRRAVVAAVAGLEAPDRGRLAAIERGLLERARRRHPGNPWWWLLLGLGLATGATAAWWVLAPDAAPTGAAPGTSPVEQSPAQPAGGREGAAPVAPEPDPDGQDGEPDRVIYIGQ